ncbi:MAG TPA: AAA family ATPase [Nitrospirae bacterium]|nr:AAA family ATPase [Nitrospirota bacterium]
MYREYFGLEELPFSITPDPRYLYMSERHREALAHLVFGINSNGGFVLLTGEIGTGKTTVCRCLLEQIPEDADIAFILNPKLTVEELLATICDEYGIRYPEGNTSIKVFVDLINSYLLNASANDRRAVLIIDEAQNLSTDVLEQLRLLTNLETNQRKLLQIILLGQPELRDKLSQPELKQLAQRVIARYHLGPLSKNDVQAYINHRLSVAGQGKQLFPTATINKLFRLSGGVPRLINVLCDRALLGAFVQGHTRVSKPTLTKAAREVFGEDTARRKGGETLKWILGFLLLAVIGTAIAVVFYDQKQSIISAPAVTVHKTAVNQQLDTLQWPAGLPVDKSSDMAFQALFDQWKAPYQAESNTPVCEQALANGLSCIEERGSLTSLRLLNRPAVLKFFDNSKNEFFVLLISLGEDTAVFMIGTEQRTVAVKDIASKWFGDYTLLWRIPPDHQGDILPNSRGPAVKWLKQQLAAIYKDTADPGKDPVFDNETVNLIKQFQLAQGLVPDGIVGTQTIIRLNTVVDNGIPKLTVNEKDNY